ncbi:MAG: type III-A CRISPR-associated protein Csm2, partial [Chloroherpetonaceae bacterium]|nr:type III-A CRISPR-associated protein Csm2 [Chloroherpetonaceae bacterium]
MTQQGRSQGAQGPDVQLPDKNIIAQIIRGDTRRLIDEAEKLGRILKDTGLTTSQIRNIYGMVKKMEMIGYEQSRGDLLLLKP